jgi:hypothetical protein
MTVWVWVIRLEKDCSRQMRNKQSGAIDCKEKVPQTSGTRERKEEVSRTSNKRLGSKSKCGRSDEWRWHGSRGTV